MRYFLTMEDEYGDPCLKAELEIPDDVPPSAYVVSRLLARVASNADPSSIGDEYLRMVVPHTP